MPEPAVVERDPFLPDPDFDVPLDNREAAEGPGSFVNSLATLAEENPEFAPTPEEIEAADGPADPRTTTPVEVAPAVPAVDEPEVVDYEDGSSITVGKEDNWWIATLDPGTGAKPEVFKGRTKGEMYQRVMVGKLNATKKINQLTKEVKLGTVPRAATQPATAPPPQTSSRQLTADEKFQIQTQLASDPDLAIRDWFQKSTGMTVDQLVALAQEGAAKGNAAKRELDIDGVARAFIAEVPEYYVCQDNFVSIIRLLSREKLGKVLGDSVTADTIADTGDSLLDNGFWTVENLKEAFEDLSEAGLLLQNPKATLEDQVEAPPAAVVAPVVQPPVTPPTVPTPARIVQTRTRPRAGLGLRTSETSGSPAAAPTSRPPSVEELNNATDEEIDTLMKGVLSLRRQEQARR